MPEQKFFEHHDIINEYPVPEPVYILDSTLEPSSGIRDSSGNKGEVPYSLVPVINKDSWPDFMRCVVDTKVEEIDFFASSKTSKRTAAVNFCVGCVVRPECLTQDLDTHHVAGGILAGFSVNKRNSLRRPENSSELDKIVSQMKTERDKLLRQGNGYWSS